MRISKFLTLIIIVFTFTASSFAQTADEIIDSHIVVIGGLEKWKAIQSVEMKNKTSVQGLEIPITITKVEGIGFRTDVNIMGNLMITVLTPTGGWMNRPAMMGGTGEPEDMPADQLKDAKSQLGIGDALLNAKLNGANVEVVSKEKVDGADVFKLKVTPKESPIFSALISATSFHLLKVITAAAGQEIEITYSNFKEVEGVTFPFTTELPSPAGGQMTMETDSIKINPAIDKSIFAKPIK